MSKESDHNSASKQPSQDRAVNSGNAEETLSPQIGLDQSNHNTVAAGQNSTAVAGNLNYIFIQNIFQARKFSVESDTLSQLSKQHAQYCTYVWGQIRSEKWSLVGVGKDENTKLDFLEYFRRLYISLDTDCPQERPALELINFQKRLVLKGKPGSGKSTFLKALVIEMAGPYRSRSPEQTESEGKSLEGEPPGLFHKIPILIKLKDFENYIEKDKKSWKASLVWEFVQQVLNKDGMEKFYDFLKSFEDKPALIFLFDGLDEVGNDWAREQILKSLKKFGEVNHPNIQIVITCREKTYRLKEWQVEGFKAFLILDLSKKQQQLYIEKWYRFWTEKMGHPDALAREKKQKLLQYTQKDDIQEISGVPILLHLMVLVNSYLEELPEGRCQLYRKALEILLHDLDKDREISFSEINQIMERLGKSWSSFQPDLMNFLANVAFENHGKSILSPAKTANSSDPLTELTEESLREKLTKCFQRLTSEEARQILQHIFHRAGILVPSNTGKVTFLHQTFQEYFAAEALVQMPDFAVKAAGLVRSHSNWRETVLMAVGIFKNRRHELSISLPLGLVGNLATAGIANDLTPHWYAVQVAAEALLQYGAEELEESGDALGADLRDRVREYLFLLATNSKVDLNDRVNLGMLLGRLGDQRKGVGLGADGLPDMDWVTIPGGPFLMGEGRGTICNKVDKDFLISRYPVTVAQFQAFVRAHGYENKELWSEAGWQWKGDRTGPETFSEKFQSLNHPQVGVAWYEAEAYCRWLSQEWKKDVRLPEEWEWEKAARGTDGRTYPWGEGTDLAERSNCSSANLNQTSMVGLFPKGASSYDVMDMVGNCWEWSKTPWDDVHSGRRVLRGGSFGSGDHYVRCAARGGGDPDFRNYGVGFRVVLSPF